MVTRQDGEVIASASYVTRTATAHPRGVLVERKAPFSQVGRPLHVDARLGCDELGLVFEPLAEAVLHAL